MVDIDVQIIFAVSQFTTTTIIETASLLPNTHVEQRKSNSVQDTLAELNSMYAQVMALIATIPLATRSQTGTLPWYDTDYALDDVIVYMYYGHKREHSAQIAAFRDRLR